MQALRILAGSLALAGFVLHAGTAAAIEPGHPSRHFDWRGFYIGGFIEVLRTDGEITGSPGIFDNGPSETRYTFDFEDLRGGLRLGGDANRGGLVFGMEASASLGINEFERTPRPGIGTADDTFHAQQTATLMLLARLGLALGD